MNKLKIALKVKEFLNGSCGKCCPGAIEFHYSNEPSKDLIKSMQKSSWQCKTCIDNFGWLRSGLTDDDIDEWETDCPCDRKINPEEIFLRLDELIDEFKKKNKPKKQKKFERRKYRRRRV